VHSDLMCRVQENRYMDWIQESREGMMKQNFLLLEALSEVSPSALNASFANIGLDDPDEKDHAYMLQHQVLL
jgi:hypothetical protein